LGVRLSLSGPTKDFDSGRRHRIIDFTSTPITAGMSRAATRPIDQLTKQGKRSDRSLSVIAANDGEEAAMRSRVRLPASDAPLRGHNTPERLP